MSEGLKMRSIALPSLVLAGLACATCCVAADRIKQVTDQLSRRDGHPVVIVESVRGRFQGHDVLCGIYRPANAPPKPGEPPVVRDFSVVDGKLVMVWGQDWNPGTLCLIRNYEMPLP
jgi:hypothetical protein